MPAPRLPRDLGQMVGQLETQLELLKEYATNAFRERRLEYLPEVATKLRVLLVRSRSNKPLLLEVADRLGLELRVTIGGPPGLQDSPEDPGLMAGDVVTLDRFFDEQEVTVKTSSDLVTMTKRELIRAWCEQLGGAHADWSVDEALVIAVNTELPVGGIRPSVLVLEDCVRIVLDHGARVLRYARELHGDNSSSE